MHIQLAPVDDSYIKEIVAEGYYCSETEAVRDAIRRMRESDKRLVYALELGDRDIEAGRVVPYTPDLLDQSIERARKNVAAGRKPKSDVIPQN